MALDIAVDSNVLSNPVLVFMKDQGAVVGQGGVLPLSHQMGWSPPLDVRRGGVRARASGKAEPAFSHRVRWSLALGDRTRRSLALGGRARQSLPLDNG